MKIKKKLIFSGIRQELVADALIGIVGAGLIAIGFFVLPLLQWIGALIVVFYLVISILPPIYNLSTLARGLGEDDFNLLLEEIAHSPEIAEDGFSYKKVMLVIEDRLREQLDAFEDDEDSKDDEG